MGCSPVARSEWARVLGVPTAAWALLTYVGFAGLAVAGLRRRAFPEGPGGLVLWAAMPCLCFGAFLVYVMTHQVGSICPSCLGLDAVHVLLLGAGAWAIRGRGGPIAALRGDLEVLWKNRQVGVAVVGGPLLAGLLVLVTYPRAGGSHGAEPSRRGELVLPDAGFYEAPIDTEGVPCIGPEAAPVVILEFSDYQCPFCRQAHAEVRQVVRAFPREVRFCHFHHPLDMACNPQITRPFHPAACLAAAAAICAMEQNEFWEMNDLLFRNARAIDQDMVHRLARGLELDEDRFSSCLRDESTLDRIEHELEISRDVPVDGTPTFLVNGRILPGAFPAEDLETIIRRLLAADGRWDAAPARNRE